MRTAAALGLSPDFHEPSHSVLLALFRDDAGRRMAIEHQHIMQTAHMPQARLLHEETRVRAKLVQCEGIDDFPVLTRNESYIWRMRSYFDVRSIYLRDNPLEKLLSGSPRSSGRLWNTAAEALAALQFCAAQTVVDVRAHVAKL